MKNLVLFFIAMICVNLSVAQSFVVYPKPSQSFKKSSDRFIVNIIQNKIIKKSFVYKSVAGNGTEREWGHEQNNSFNFTTFSFTGSVTVEIIKLNSNAASATIRPNRWRFGCIKTTSSGRDKTIKIHLNRPAKLSIEFSDDPSHKDALMIFADKIENLTDVPDKRSNSVLVVNSAANLKAIPGNKTTVYFSPGVYDVNYWDIPSNIKQVYISGGAYVRGYLHKEMTGNVGDNVKINGRGILSNEGYSYHYPVKGNGTDNDSQRWYKPIDIQGGVNNFIEGITIIESTAFNIMLNGANSSIQNVKINGFRYNNDGITISGSGNKITDCFIMTNDDALVLYASNFSLTNCVFWQLQGSVIQLGWTPHSMQNITIANCDILHDKASNSDGNVGFINAMNYRKADKISIVKNVNISNIYFDTPILRFVDIRNNRKSKFGIGADSSVGETWIYKDFNFNNIHFSQNYSTNPLIYLHGFSDDHPLTNFKFVKIFFQGSKASADRLNDSKVTSLNNVDGIEMR